MAAGCGSTPALVRHLGLIIDVISVERQQGLQCKRETMKKYTVVAEERACIRIVFEVTAKSAALARYCVEYGGGKMPPHVDKSRCSSIKELRRKDLGLECVVTDIERIKNKNGKHVVKEL